ncbi:MAG: Panacea domain-containing protein [Bacteroidota bacterium]|nr:Panacea domain-containing protein [Bacteroidota bacterium]
MELNNTYRKKMLHAIIYFTKKVKNPTKVKIFKLLFFSDFEHFKETGNSITNLDYYAYDFGPVPKHLYEEISDNKVPEDFSPYITLLPFKSEESGKQGAIFKVKEKIKPDLTIFSPRQQRVLEKFADMFRDVDAKMISDISHFKNHPWDKTKNEKGLFNKIEYILALDDESKISVEDAMEAMKEREEMFKVFPLKKTI